MEKNVQLKTYTRKTMTSPVFFVFTYGSYGQLPRAAAAIRMQNQWGKVLFLRMQLMGSWSPLFDYFTWFVQDCVEFCLRLGIYMFSCIFIVATEGEAYKKTLWIVCSFHISVVWYDCFIKTIIWDQAQHHKQQLVGFVIGTSSPRKTWTPELFCSFARPC